MEPAKEILSEGMIEEKPQDRFLDKLKIHKFKILGGVLGVLILVGTVFGAYKFGQRQVQPSPQPSPIVYPSPSAYSCVEKSSLNCAEEMELSFQCTEEYQSWARENCPGWEEKVYCQEPRPQVCTMECITNPPYICGSDGNSYCSTCQACAEAKVKWYVIQDTPCGVE